MDSRRNNRQKQSHTIIAQDFIYENTAPDGTMIYKKKQNKTYSRKRARPNYHKLGFKLGQF
jgi:hypothetical protein